MAVFNSKLDDKGASDKLVSLYTKTAQSITEQLKEASTSGIARRNQILAQINAELKSLGVDTSSWINTNIPLQYRAGMQKAIEGLKQTQSTLPFYRGTGKNVMTPGDNMFGNGYYITSDKKVAEQFGDNITTVYFNNFDPKSILRINSQDDYQKLVNAALNKYPNLEDQEAIPKYVQSLGYKAVLGTNNLDPLAGINVLDKTMISTTPAIEVTTLFTPIDRQTIKALVDNSTRSFADALTTVGRSVKNITHEVFQQEVKARIAEGTITGETRKSIAASIKQKIEDKGISALKDKGGNSWTLDRYAQMLTNTQLAEARNTGLQNKMLQNSSDLVQVSINGSSHPECADYEGQILSLNGDTPGYDTVDDAEANGLFHPNAVLSGTIFTPYGELNEMIGADYEGPAIRISTAGNHKLTIGPNHPILTQRGLVRASDLLKSDYLFYDTRIITPDTARNTNLKQMPLVEDAFQTLLLAGGSIAKVPTTSHDFHGDRSFCKGEIKVIEPTSRLLPILNSCLIEQFRDIDFVETSVKDVVLSSDGSGSLNLGRISLTSPSGVSSRLSCYNLVHITSLHNIRFKGKAFDASTSSSLYNSNGFVVSNCQHTINAVEPDLAEATYGWSTDDQEYVQGISDSGGDASAIDNTL